MSYDSDKKQTTLPVSDEHKKKPAKLLKGFECEEVEEVHPISLIEQVIHVIGVHGALRRLGLLRGGGRQRVGEAEADEVGAEGADLGRARERRRGVQAALEDYHGDGEALGPGLHHGPEPAEDVDEVARRRDGGRAGEVEQQTRQPCLLVLVVEADALWGLRRRSGRGGGDVVRRLHGMIGSGSGDCNVVRLRGMIGGSSSA